MTSPANVHTIMDKPSLLFVDDEPSILTALRVVFRVGYNVTTTTDGFEAVELLKTKKFDVIVSDQRMPTMTGVELLRHARDLSPDTIRVLLTGYSDTDAILGAINDVEVHRFLQKPWDNAKLKQTVTEAIDLARSLAQTVPSVNASSTPATADEPPKKLADVVPLPVQHRPPPTIEEFAAPATADKEAILVVDAKRTLFEQTHTEMNTKINVLHAANLMEVFRTLEKTQVSSMVCAFDVQSEADRTFLQMLKQDHPYILVIAVCDSTDSTRLIELINNAKIFRFVKKPVNMGVLSRHIVSAVTQAQEIRKNPALIRKQRAEAMPDALVAGSAAQLLREQFAKLNQSMAPGIAKLLSFFRRA